MRSSANGKSSRRRRQAGSIAAIAIGMMAVLAGVYGLGLLTAQRHAASSAEPEPSAVASIAGGDRSTTIIVSTPNSNDCRHYQLNVATGARDDKGAIDCAADSSHQPGRLEAISKAFRSH
jgi:hypothetical protein